MPEPARGPGVEALMKELDRRIATEGNDTVDEKIFFQALEDTAPSHLAPVMMESIKHYSQGYKKEQHMKHLNNHLMNSTRRL